MKWKSARAHLKLDGDRILGISGGDRAGVMNGKISVGSMSKLYPSNWLNVPSHKGFVAPFFEVLGGSRYVQDLG